MMLDPGIWLASLSISEDKIFYFMNIDIIKLKFDISTKLNVSKTR